MSDGDKTGYILQINVPVGSSVRQAQDLMQLKYLEQVLLQHGGHRGEAARELGCTEQNLTKHIRRLTRRYGKTEGATP